jgi:hypothetical protein
MTPAQCRAARALIRMWLDDLARGAGRAHDKEIYDYEAEIG